MSLVDELRNATRQRQVEKQRAEAEALRRRAAQHAVEEERIRPRAEAYFQELKARLLAAASGSAHDFELDTTDLLPPLLRVLKKLLAAEGLQHRTEPRVTSGDRVVPSHFYEVLIISW